MNAENLNETVPFDGGVVQGNEVTDGRTYDGTEDLEIPEALKRTLTIQTEAEVGEAGPDKEVQPTVH